MSCGWEQTSDNLCVFCRQAKQAVSNSLSSVRQQCEVLREQLEEEQESKQEMQRLVSKLNSEVTHWRTKQEADGIQHADELEETKCVVLILAAFTSSVTLWIDSVMYDLLLMWNLSKEEARGQASGGRGGGGGHPG